jgi:hypothetical protein
VWPQDTLAGGRVVVLVWHAGRATYAVSLHGHTRLNERLDRAIALHLRYLVRE